MCGLRLHAANSEMRDAWLSGLLLQRLLQTVELCLLVVQHASGLFWLYCERRRVSSHISNSLSRGCWLWRGKLTAECAGENNQFLSKENNKWILCRDSEGEEEEDLVEEPSKPWWKFWIIMSADDRMIEMRNLEEARSSRSGIIKNEFAKVVLRNINWRKKTIHLYQFISENAIVDRSERDYFDGSWSRDDWAHLDEFSITWPDLNLWIRPEYHNKFISFE